MRRLYQLIVKFNALLIFLVFQVIAITLLIRTNDFHYSTFFSSSSKVVGNVMKKRQKVVDYFHYSEVNKDLSEEIAANRNMAKSSFQQIGKSEFYEVEDTVYMQKWNYTNTRIVNKTVNRLQNFITLDKGTSHGIRKDMGVVFNDKIVGIVKNVSENFAVVLPVVNEKFKTSVKHKRSKDFGTLEDWDGIDPGYSYVNGVPSTVNIQEGDSILTSGLSVYFPENIVVGTVSEIDYTDSGDTYIIKVKLATDFYSVTYVQVVGNILKIEQEELEIKSEEDDS